MNTNIKMRIYKNTSGKLSFGHSGRAELTLHSGSE